MNEEVKGLLIVIGLAFGVAYLYWLTYQNPNKNGLTRFVDKYVEATRSPAMSRKTTLLVVIFSMLATGLVALGFLVNRLGRSR